MAPSPGGFFGRKKKPSCRPSLSLEAYLPQDASGRPYAGLGCGSVVLPAVIKGWCVLAEVAEPPTPSVEPLRPPRTQEEHRDATGSKN